MGNAHIDQKSVGFVFKICISKQPTDLCLGLTGMIVQTANEEGDDS